VKIAFMNLCHTDPDIVVRAAARLTRNHDFDMYVHVDNKTEIDPFVSALSGIRGVYFTDERINYYWGGFNAVKATVMMLRQALGSERHYDYFVILQNLDYPARSNDYIQRFFREHTGTEFIRGCRIARSADWHFAKKYKIYNRRDDDFYIKNIPSPGCTPDTRICWPGARERSFPTESSGRPVYITICITGRRNGR